MRASSTCTCLQAAARHRTATESFEEMFTVLDGEVQVTFRGQVRFLRTPGRPMNVQANAPHAFTNTAGTPSPVAVPVRTIQTGRILGR